MYKIYTVKRYAVKCEPHLCLFTRCDKFVQPPQMSRSISIISARSLLSYYTSDPLVWSGHVIALHVWETRRSEIIFRIWAMLTNIVKLTTEIIHILYVHEMFGEYTILVRYMLIKRMKFF